MTIPDEDKIATLEEEIEFLEQALASYRRS